ncbi:MAG: NlpC/P60 family protein [Boseongicola sp.]|nr:NlpC/P60 family protein [Boseongicola sp.]MDD9976405.1 NlpC/P60 family protein [Boseongicola sp.]
MTPGESFVASAKSWIGTPYKHQCSVKGAGCDCLGLLLGIWREHYGEHTEEIPPYSRDWDEVAQNDLLEAALDKHLIRKSTSQISLGDVLLFRMRSGAVAKHLGICSDASTPMFIHAYSGHGVVENALSLPWQRRLAGVFAVPVPTEKLN